MDNIKTGKETARLLGNLDELITIILLTDMFSDKKVLIDTIDSLFSIKFELLLSELGTSSQTFTTEN